MKKPWILLATLSLSLITSNSVNYAGVNHVNLLNLHDNQSSKIVEPQVEPGSERYTVVYTKTDSYYVSAQEAGFNSFTSTAFWSSLTGCFNPGVGFLASFFQNALFVPQENDLMYVYCAITYDSLMNRFEWNSHTVVTRNGKKVNDHTLNRTDAKGSIAYNVFMSEYGHRIPNSHL